MLLTCIGSLIVNSCTLLVCRGGLVFSFLVSTNSNYFHFLHMWYLLVNRGGTRVVQILCTRLTRMFSRFASYLHRSLIVNSCTPLVCRGGLVFSFLVSTNSNYFHFLHMWYLLVNRGGTRVVQILCTRLTRMFSRFASYLHRFTYCQFLYSPRVSRRSCFFIFSFNKFKLFSFLAYVVPPRQSRRYQSCPNFMYSFDEDVL